MTKILRNRQARKCCVRGCRNAPQKGRKTCGHHGQTRPARVVKTSPIHLDRVLNTWREFDDSVSAGPVAVNPLPTERPYLADVAVRSDGAILGLPTTPDGLKRLLSAWLLRPGCTLAIVEQLTPAHLPRLDRASTICTAASALVVYDLRHGGSA